MDPERMGWRLSSFGDRGGARPCKDTISGLETTCHATQTLLVMPAVCSSRLFLRTAPLHSRPGCQLSLFLHDLRLWTLLDSAESFKNASLRIELNGPTAWAKTVHMRFLAGPSAPASEPTVSESALGWIAQ